jgi:hypothetical protein
LGKEIIILKSHNYIYLLVTFDMNSFIYLDS